MEPRKEIWSERTTRRRRNIETKGRYRVAVSGPLLYSLPTVYPLPAESTRQRSPLAKRLISNCSGDHFSFAPTTLTATCFFPVSRFTLRRDARQSKNRSCPLRVRACGRCTKSDYRILNVFLLE